MSTTWPHRHSLLTHVNGHLALPSTPPPPRTCPPSLLHVTILRQWSSVCYHSVAATTDIPSFWDTTARSKAKDVSKEPYFLRLQGRIKIWGSASIRSRPLHSKYFQIRHSSATSSNSLRHARHACSCSATQVICNSFRKTKVHLMNFSSL